MCGLHPAALYEWPGYKAHTECSQMGGGGGGVSWNMLPQEIFNTLRLLLRPFCDRSRAVVATWLTGYCFWLSVYAFAKPADIKFLREKVLQLADGVTDGDIICREY